jgi:hypothetical protein
MAISTGLALLGGAILSSAVQSNAASKASSAQIASADRGISEQRRQFNEVQKLLAPFVGAGTSALGQLAPYMGVGPEALEQQRALTGLAGPDAQRAAIGAIEGSPEFAALTRQGENAILQQAAATGGLRGGNVQGALAQFRPQVLSGLIEQQYNRLGGLTALGQQTTQNVMTAGQNAAAGVGTAGMQTGANISNLMQQQGAARAGSALAQGQAFGKLLGSAGMAFGRGMAYQGYTPQGASAPLTFGQGMFYGGGTF